MKIIRLSVGRPVTTCMFMLLLVMGGIFTLSRMSVELFPNISIPTLAVFTSNQKASPEDIHKDITLPMEEILNGVTGLSSLGTISFEGESMVILEFKWGTDVNVAEIEVREKVNALKLPDSAQKPIIKKFDPGASPVFRFDIFGKEGAGLTTEDLRLIADTNVKPRLERVDGVGEVQVLGGTEPEYLITGLPDKLAQFNLSILSVIRAVQEEARNKKGGNLQIEGGNLIVGRIGPGEVLRIRDVATVERTSKDAETYARIDGEPSVGLAIKKTSSASVVSVVQSIRAELAALEGDPVMETLRLRVSQDDSEYVVNAQEMVISSIVQGLILAAILLILFLRDVRPTIILVIATLVSMISAFMVLNGVGLSRNVLTLGGLGLAAGMTLDSSIVLLDSIFKQLSNGKTPKDAAITGASEVAGGVISSTMTTVAVFLPILFIPGLMREIFKDLAYAILAAIMFSMVVGIVFIPMVSARLLTPPKKPGEEGQKGLVMRIITLPWTLISSFMIILERSLERMLEGVLRFFLTSGILKVVTLAILLSVSLFSLRYLPGFGFIPQGQVNELWIRFETPVGSTLAYADARIRQVEELFKEEPYASFVESVSADVQADEARLFVKLYPNKKVQARNERGEKIDEFQPMRPPEWNSLSLCVDQIRQGCDSIPDLKGQTFVTIVDKVKGGTAAPISFKIFRRQSASNLSEADDLKLLQEEAKRDLLIAMESVSSALYQRVRIYETPKEFNVTTEGKRKELHERGLTTEQVSLTIRASAYGVIAESVYEDDGREVDINVLLGAGDGGETDMDANAIENLKVRSMITGELTEIREVANVSEVPAEGSVVFERTNRKPTATMESHFRPYEITGETVGDVTDQIEANLQEIPGFLEKYDYEIQSTAGDTRDSFSDAAKAFLISVVLIYMIMCSQFERFSDPLAIMITVPLSAIGSVVVLNLAGEITSLAALVGGVVLCGVVVNNGIILVEYINIMRARGIPRNEAIIQGSVRKLRSILITSLTSILGMVPLVLGVGEGTELYRGVAAVIVGGLLCSTPLTLIALPITYSLMDEFSVFISNMGFRLSMLTRSKK